MGEIHMPKEYKYDRVVLQLRDKNLHLALKQIALDKGKLLVDIAEEALWQYAKKNKKKA